MEIWKLALLFASALAGGLSIFFSKKANTQRLKLILSFSGAYLFGITVLHLIPEVYVGGDQTIGLYILGGFIFQIVLEQFSEGIEHGHIHAHAHQQMAFPLGIMASLCIHAFLEGMPLSEGHRNELLYGIALHHIPAAFALGMVLMHHQVSKSNTILFLVLFASMSPLGYVFSNALSTGEIGGLQLYFGRIMGVVIGMFLHISTTILFESSVDHRFNFKKMMAVSWVLVFRFGLFKSLISL